MDPELEIVLQSMDDPQKFIRLFYKLNDTSIAQKYFFLQMQFQSVRPKLYETDR